MFALLLFVAVALAADCPRYEQWAGHRHGPYSEGQYKFPYQRPDEGCRTFQVPEVEKVIDTDMTEVIGDPDLYRLFENTWPNTIDTTIFWQGVSDHNPEEELAFITTGDIHAMWLRDSANQLQSYKPILARSKSIRSLFRGAINLQSRYIRAAPYCNAFRPPPEQSKPRGPKIEGRDTVKPEYNNDIVFECKYELDSLAAFLQLSWDYYEETEDAEFFSMFNWTGTVETIVQVAKGMQQGTYDEYGQVLQSPYTWLRDANSASEVVANAGNGAPVKGNIGLVRSFFRPSDDSCIYQYFIPGNMMLARYLTACAPIMRPLNLRLAEQMEDMAAEIQIAINQHAIIQHPKFGEMYAYEIDGFGSYSLMDDANLPSLLSIPHMGYKPASRHVYLNTRAFVTSSSNPYYGYGPVLNATGGPHLGPGMAWPMGLIIQIMTSDDDEEIANGIKQLLGATSGLGVIHESVDSHDDARWTRPWFAWANGLFGQMILDLSERKPHLLARSYQDEDVI